MTELRPSRPFHKLQIEHNNQIDHRNEQEGNECCRREPSDLCITHRFPKRTTVKGQREQSDNGRADCDKDGTESHDTGVQHCLLERFALSVPFLDEIEKHESLHFPRSTFKCSLMGHKWGTRVLSAKSPLTTSA